MKMLLFGWLLKGRCEVTLADEFIGWAVGVSLALLLFLWFSRDSK